MAIIHSTNDSNVDVNVLVKNKEIDGTTNLTNKIPDTSTKQIQQQQDLSNLPAQQESEASINFLGSSYSGQDIKVVAHLYNQKPETEGRRVQLELELAIANHMKDATTKLNGTDLESLLDLDTDSFEVKRKAILDLAGLTDADEAQQIAFKRIFDTVFNNREGGNLGSFLGLSKIRRALTNIANTQDSIIPELNEQIRQVSEASSASHRTVVLGTLQTISIQSHREKFGVRALGLSYVKGYTRGQRTIAGSMIFTVFHAHALAELTRALFGKDDLDPNPSTVLPDQLPPVDLTIAFANEYGQRSEARLYGVEFVNDGVVYSIEDLLSENTINYVCRDADLLTDVGKIQIDRTQRFSKDGTTGLGKDRTGTSLIFDNADYDEYLDRLGVRRRFKSQ